jgi:hypothetical protein
MEQFIKHFRRESGGVWVMLDEAYSRQYKR